jgi:hypothetical protein
MVWLSPPFRATTSQVACQRWNCDRAARPDGVRWPILLRWLKAVPHNRPIVSASAPLSGYDNNSRRTRWRTVRSTDDTKGGQSHGCGHRGVRRDEAASGRGRHSHAAEAEA